MSRTVDIAERIAELLQGKQLDLTTATVSYTLVMGRETLNIRSADFELRHSEVIHPNGKCEGMHLCNYCGKPIEGRYLNG